MKTKRILGIAIILFIFLLSLLYPLNISNAFADENNTLTVDMYTDDDKLLNSDGTESLTEIDDFAQTVISSDIEVNLSDLTKVIPVEYLRTTGEEK